MHEWILNQWAKGHTDLSRISTKLFLLKKRLTIREASSAMFLSQFCCINIRLHINFALMFEPQIRTIWIVQLPNVTNLTFVQNSADIKHMQISKTCLTYPSGLCWPLTRTNSSVCYRTETHVEKRILCVFSSKQYCDSASVDFPVTLVVLPVICFVLPFHHAFT